LGQLDISSEHRVKFIEECEAKAFSEGFRNQWLVDFVLFAMGLVKLSKGNVLPYGRIPQ